MIKSKWPFVKENLLNPSFFRIVYFLTLFAAGISFIDAFAYVIACVNLVFAVLISVNSVILNKRIMKTKYFPLLLLFLATTVLTALFNINISFIKGYEWSFVLNIISSFFAFICFFIFYGMYTEDSAKTIKNEMLFIFKIVVLLTTVCTIIGFIITLFKSEIVIDSPFKGFPEIIQNVSEPKYVLGIIKKPDGTRFEGIFTNPNIMAFYCTISLIFCHILVSGKNFLKTKNKFLFYSILTICLVSNFVALIVSDSYASFIFLITYAICIIFCKFVASAKNRSAKDYIFKSLAFILAGFIIILSLLCARSYFQTGASDLISDISSFFSSDSINLENEPDIKFGRPNHDLRGGSGRKVLLNQALVMFKNHPILGVGPYTSQYHGSVYFDSGLIFSNFHNGYVSVLVYYGILGFSLFLIFLILVFFRMCKFLFKNKQHGIYQQLFSILVSYLVFSLFEKTMLSENNFMCSFFWIVLGYTVTYISLIDPLVFRVKSKKTKNLGGI